MRHIHTGRSGNHPTATICCYPNALEEPAIVTSFGLLGGELSYFGDGDIGAVADLGAVEQSGITLRRFPFKQRDFLGALVTQETVFVGVTYPLAAQALKMAVHAAVIRALVRLGVDRQSLQSENNDVLLQSDGASKKVFGDFTVQGEQFNTCAGFTTFSFDTESARAIYNLKAGKFVRKSDVRDIGDIVCGLRDVYPDIGMAAYRDAMVDLLAERLGEDVEAGAFTLEERTTLDDICRKMQDKDWLNRGQWPR